MIAKNLFITAAFLAASASHAMTIDFEGLAAGSSPGDYYYASTGIRFQGGIVQTNSLGNYLQGPFTLTFDAPPVTPNLNPSTYGLSFLATRWDIDGGYSWTYSSQGKDPLAWVQGTANPHCSTQAECDQEGYIYIPRSTLFGYFTGVSTGTNMMQFNVDGADDLFFGATGRGISRRDVPLVAASVGSSEVPEPGALALMVAGLFGLAWNGRTAGSLISVRRRSHEGDQKHSRGCSDVLPCATF